MLQKLEEGFVSLSYFGEEYIHYYFLLGKISVVRKIFWFTNSNTLLVISFLFLDLYWSVQRTKKFQNICKTKLQKSSIATWLILIVKKCLFYITLPKNGFNINCLSTMVQALLKFTNSHIFITLMIFFPFLFFHISLPDFFMIF